MEEDDDLLKRIYENLYKKIEAQNALTSEVFKLNKKAQELINQNQEVIIKRIYDALYPVLYPVEEQSLDIQNENHKLVMDLAECVWKTFKENC